VAGRRGCLFGTSAAPFDSSSSAMMTVADAVAAVVGASDSAWRQRDDFPDGIAGS